MATRIVVLSILAACLPALAQVDGCVGSVSVAEFRLMAASDAPGSPVWVPLRRINNLPRGYRLRYQPGRLDPSADPKDAALTLVLVPKDDGGEVTVLQPGPATAVSEWMAPFDAWIVLLVYAPQGLDARRLTNLVTKDPTLVTALADYADQTAELEATLAALSQIESEDEDAFTPARASTPAERALLALVRALNPAVSSFDPLGAGRRAGPTSMMGRGAEAFFNNAGGFVPGGGILPSVKSWLLPDTEFRSVFGTSSDSGDMNLCAQRQGRSRNKIAYVWAYRLTTASAPPATIVGGTDNVADLPIGRRAGVPLKLNAIAGWDLLERVYDWALVPSNGGLPIRVPVQPRAAERQLWFDLRQFPGGPGLYTIEGRWDWSPYRVAGSLRLHRLDDLSAARLTPESQDRLISGTGPVALVLTGANLRFIERAWMHRPDSVREIPVDLPAEHLSPPDQLRVEVDTDGLRPGPYLLALARMDGVVADVPVQLLPPPPRLEGPPVRVHVGDPQQTVTLRGSGLDRLERLEADAAAIDLLPPGGDDTRRQAVVRLQPAAQPGARMDLAAQVRGMTSPLRLPGALQVAGARPRIAEATPSVPAGLAVAPQSGELPAGSFVSFALRLQPEDARPVVTLQCAEAARTVIPMKLMVGERLEIAQLTQAGPGRLFLSLDPGAVGQSGCSLTATAETEELGASDPFPLGKVVRMPRIATFRLTNEPAPGGYAGELQGWDLETIEQTGWNATSGLPVPELPRPLAGEGAKQSLRIAVPWPSPSPKAPLYIWLRGETSGRATTVTPP
jgi:hypothetical protein